MTLDHSCTIHPVMSVLLPTMGIGQPLSCTIKCKRLKSEVLVLCAGGG